MLENIIQLLINERDDGLPPQFVHLSKKEKFRALCNIRPPKIASEELLKLQDIYLQEQSVERGIVDVNSLNFQNNIALWKGDITRLNCDCIVNAGNSKLLGCFQPLHNCIDNVIHTNAGVQVRLDCDNIMKGRDLPNGEVRVTKAYNLPSQYILHTVGPIVAQGIVTKEHEEDLKRCYVNSLETANEMGLQHIAFSCISTGVYGYPKAKAAELASETVKEWLQAHGTQNIHVIFDVFTDEDEKEYEKQLSK